MPDIFKTDPPENAHKTHESDVRLRKWGTWIGVGGMVFFTVYFFVFLIAQSLSGDIVPKNWLIQIEKTHYAALVGTPMSAITAFCIVSLLKVTSGPIEFEAFGLKFRGASGPIILWALCFGAVVGASYWLWSRV